MKKIMKDKEIHELIDKKIQSEIDKFKKQMGEIFANEMKSLDEKLAIVESLIKDYTRQKNDNTSRDAQRSHENNDAPLSRNRVIIEAELKQHQMQFQENWEKNTDHADGKYTSDKHEQWTKKLVQLQTELKNSPN